MEGTLLFPPFYPSPSFCCQEWVFLKLSPDLGTLPKRIHRQASLRMSWQLSRLQNSRLEDTCLGAEGASTFKLW